jgi:hypothetical protein
MTWLANLPLPQRFQIWTHPTDRPRTKALLFIILRVAVDNIHILMEQFGVGCRTQHLNQPPSPNENDQTKDAQRKHLRLVWFRDSQL